MRSSFFRSGLLAMSLVFLGLNTTAKAVEPPVLVFEAGTGTVLHAENVDSLWYPASLTKLMTAYLVFEAIAEGRTSLGATVTMSAAAAGQPPSRFTGKAGTTFTVQEGLMLLIARSSNDVAYALAEHAGGSYQNFIASMNRKARLLGMTRTNFVNSHGLPAPDQVTTARDMARLSNAIIRDYPQYTPLFRAERFTLNGEELTSHNRLLKDYAGADGLKTGYICSSGWNIIASASRDGRRLVVVTFGNENARARATRAGELLDRGFATFGLGRSTIETLAEQQPTIRPVDMRPMMCRQNPQRATLGPVPSFLAGSQSAQAAASMTPSLPAMGDRGANAATSPASAASADMAPIPPRRPLQFRPASQASSF